MTPLLGSLSLRTIGIGAAAVAAGVMFTRPLLVKIFTAAYDAKDAAEGAWQQARTEAAEIRREARTAKSEA